MITRIIILFQSLICGTSFLVPTFRQRNTFATISTRQRMSYPTNETFTENVMTRTAINQEIEEDLSMSLVVPAWTNSVPSLESSGYVKTIHSVHDFVQFIDGSSSLGQQQQQHHQQEQQQQQQQQQHQDQLLIVKFHAHYCKICSRTILKYKKMAAKYSLENNKGIAFANVEVTENPKLCQILGVTRFPFIQIFRNGERVASFGTGPAHNFQKIVGDTMDELLYRTTQEDWEKKRRKFALELQQSKDQLKELRSLAMMEDECRKAGVNWLGYNISP